MQLVAVGLDHATASLPLRERVAFDPVHLQDALVRLHRLAGPCFILSTCNRVELYAIAGHAESGARALSGFLASHHGVPSGLLGPSLRVRSHDGAVRHLFRVTAGLESMVLGEDQIQAQVKAALDHAREAGTLGGLLERIGSSALEVGKQVRTSTSLSRSSASVVSVGLECAESHLGDLAGASVLIVGAGRMAAVTLGRLNRPGRQPITVVSRTDARSARLAERFGTLWTPWCRLGEALQSADLLVSATSSPGLVVSAATLSDARATGRPLVCLDLAVPRDIESSAGQLPGVVLYDVDRLQPLAARAKAQRAAEIAPADAIVEAGVLRFLHWWQARTVAPAIRRLRVRADAVRDAEVSRAIGRLRSLDAHEQEVIREMAARLVNKLLDSPMRAVQREPEAANLASALERLFELAGESRRALEDAGAGSGAS